MLGNLSKVLFKAPSFFNNSIQANTINSLNKDDEDSTIYSFNSRHINRYFREKDFWKKNFEPEINFNNNKRLSFYINTSPGRQKRLKNYNNIISLKNIRYNTINKNKKNLNILTDSPVHIKDNLKKNFTLNRYKSHINKKNVSGNNIWLRIDLNKLIKDKYKLNKYIKINKNTYQNEKGKKFPTISNGYKSQETLFQDKADNTLRSLNLVRPEIKEQLKTKNRFMVGKRDYDKYLNSFRKNSQNPFYESMKVKEEMNNYLK